MALIQTVYASDFHDAFIRCGRGDQFSYEAREILFNYLDDLSTDTGEDQKLDVVSICCDFYESSGEEILKSYSSRDISEMTDEEIEDAARKYLVDQGVLVGETSSSFIYQAH